MPRIYRSSDDIVLYGVLGGLADYFKVNSDFLRVAFVLIAVASGSLFLMTALYFICALLMPKKTNEFESNYTYSDVHGNDFKDSSKSFKDYNNNSLLGYTLIGLGVFFTLNRLLFIYMPRGSMFALALILLGLFILFRKDRWDNNEK